MDYDRWNKAQATRVTYGEWLDLAMEQNPWILALQADVDKSVRTDIAAKHHGYFNGKTGRVFDVGIRENGMFGISAGLPTCGFYPSLSTFAMFGPMGLGIFNQITATHLPYMVVNSHGGLQVEQDGKTHMDLLSPAQFGANPRIRVIEPGDSRSAAQLLTNAFNNRDAQPFTFVRTSRSSITAQEDLGDIDTRCYRVKVLNPTKETGRTITIVASGAMMGVAREVADLINNSAQHSGKVIRIVDAFAPKEFGKISVKDEDALGNPSVVVTLIDADPEILEDSVTKYLHRRKMTGEVLALGALPDDAQSGTAKAIYDAAGLSPQKIFDRIAEFINQAI
ncbi:MAG: transketolase C-terminal domain-containing protein [Candidatus Margulisiibacteriota bacterium]